LHTKYVDLARSGGCYRDDAQDDTPRLTLLGRCAHAAPYVALLVWVFGRTLGVW
jgi:hypothetical protein